MNRNPYAPADKTAKALRRKAIRRFQTAKTRMSAAKFDELNVLRLAKELYEELEKDNEAAFLSLAREVYQNANVGETQPGKAWLKKRLNDYDPVLLYVYLHEVERKRERTAEAINAAKDKNYEFKKALSLWSRMTSQVADNMAYEAHLQALVDSGVKYVRWETQEDEKVCETCGPRDGKIYPIDKIPPRPHWRCRCWIKEATEKEFKRQNA